MKLSPTIRVAGTCGMLGVTNIRHLRAGWYNPAMQFGSVHLDLVDPAAAQRYLAGARLDYVVDVAASMSGVQANRCDGDYFNQMQGRGQ